MVFQEFFDYADLGLPGAIERRYWHVFHFLETPFEAAVFDLCFLERGIAGGEEIHRHMPRVENAEESLRVGPEKAAAFGAEQTPDERLDALRVGHSGSEESAVDCGAIAI